MLYLLAVLQFSPCLDFLPGFVTLVDTGLTGDVAPSSDCFEFGVVLKVQSQVSEELDRLLQFLFPQTNIVDQCKERLKRTL